MEAVALAGCGAAAVNRPCVSWEATRSKNATGKKPEELYGWMLKNDGGDDDVVLSFVKTRLFIGRTFSACFLPEVSLFRDIAWIIT